MTNRRVPDFDTVTSPPRRPEISYDAVKDGEVIGSGGQATVKRVSLSDPDPPDTVAVKEPQAPSETVDTTVIESFFEEAETWAKLANRERTDQYRDTDHIVGIVAIGEDLPWLAMEYMDGGNLADRLDSHPNGLPINEALWIAECICEGLKIAHDNGVAHLDLKPANILFRETPGEKWDVPKIADWGLARSLLADSQRMDMLSVEYAAPEQFNSGKPDTYTDIYQLGVIIYEMVTGELPYTGGQAEVKHDVISKDDPEPPSNYNEQVPRKLDEITLKALSTAKPQRYQGSVDRLRDAINDIRQSDLNINTVCTETSEWPTFQGGPTRTGYQPTGSELQTPVSKEWIFDIDRTINRQPAVAEETVFTGSHNLYGVDMATGEEMWTFETVDGITSPPSVADSTVFVGSADYSLYAVDSATGDKKWEYRTYGEIHSSPAVVNRTVLTGSKDGNLYAVDTVTGDKQWQFETRSEINTSPAVADATVYIGNNDGVLYAIDTSTGAEVWKFETADAIHSAPTVVDGTVFFGSDDGNLYAIDSDTGEELWHITPNEDDSGTLATGTIHGSPAVTDDTVFFGRGNLYAVDANTGKEYWKNTQKWRPHSSPVLIDDIVLVTGDNLTLYAVNRYTGKKLWEFSHVVPACTPAVANSTIYIGRMGTGLYAIN